MSLVKNMHIYIPSLGRHNKQVTVGSIPKRWHAFTTVLIPDNEEMARAYHYALSGPRDRGLIVQQCPVHGIGATRQYVVDKQDHRYVLFLDDDMYFYKRDQPHQAKLHKCSDDEMEDLLSTLYRWLTVDGFAHVGISARQGNNHVLRPYKDVTRMNNAYAYDTSVLLKEQIHFGRLRIMEDFDVTLSLLRRGYPNRVSYEYVWNQVGSGEQGGCSTYRTPELQAQAARELEALHHGFVTVREKTSKSTSNTWKGMKTRTDVVIAWRKAFKGHVVEDTEAETVYEEEDRNASHTG